MENTDITKTNTTQKKQTTQNTAKQNYSRLLQHSARKRGGLILLQRWRAHTGQ